MTNKKEKIAIYAGSFDPITLGHIDVLKNGAKMFDKVIIAVADNPNKKCMFSVEERIKFIKNSIKDIPNAEVDSFKGLTVEYAKKKNADILLRGLRTTADFEFETQLSQNNRAICEDIKTVFLITKPEYSFISSSAVKEILINKGDISKFVPKGAYDLIQNQNQKG
ncbi:pantetheine-phosphate adenylyltransferase [bacterium]|nr:pantetheine-phosphate adenylyltransferase [bacterium]